MTLIGTVSSLFVFVFTLSRLIIINASMDPFKQCLVSTPATSFGYCLGVGALNQLQTLDSDPTFDIADGVTFTRDAQEVRENVNFLERDPSDYRGIIDTFNQVFSRRGMRWDMGFLYPGLAMRVAPSVSNAGLLEFVLDPRHEAISQHSLKEASTGRLLARQFLVPLLLGFKFNIATIIPVIFGIIAVIAKKAAFLSKLALIASSAFGLGSLLFGSHVPFLNHGVGSPSGFGGGFAPQYNRYPEEEYSETTYRGNRVSEDQLRLYNGIQNQGANIIFTREEKTNGRNFAWSEDPKEKP